MTTKANPGAILVSTLLGAAASAHAAEQWRMVELAAPSIWSDEEIELSVKTGPLPRGARLVIMTDKGDVLGTVTPFVMRGAASTATIPAPHSAFDGGKLRLRLQLIEPGAEGRPPRSEEVESLEILARPSR